MNNEDFFFTRHTLRPDPANRHDEVRPESKKYKGITEEGISLARERAEKEIVDIVENMPKNGVMFLGGSSQIERTKSTVRVYGESLIEHYSRKTDIVIIDEEYIQKNKDKEFKVLNYIKSIIDKNPNKKIVIIYPLFLKELSLIPDFIDPTSNKQNNYAKLLFKKANGSEPEGAKIFIKSNGEFKDDETDESVKGVTSQQIAQKHIHAIRRLRDFSQKISDSYRPITLGIVGHAWILDSLVSYLANDGIADIEGFKKAGDKMIDKTELGQVTVKDGSATFKYRGKEFKISLELI